MVAPDARDARIWGRYRILEPVGRGSFGRVLKVTDAETGESRALKVVPRGAGEAMLLDEFEQLARLRHPSLPRVFEVGRTQAPIDDLPPGSPFFVAEWIAGGRCDAQPWTGRDLAARIWALIGDVAGALATIHAAGLVHSDVAPQNILLADDGRAVLVDLGLGAASGPSRISGAFSDARGTPAYMAPEAIAGDSDPRSDLYGLGATVVRLVTGRPLFEATGLGDLLQRVLAGGAPPELPELPRPLADLIGRLIARDPDARPLSALAVLDELDQLAPAIDLTGEAAAPPRPAGGAVGSARDRTSSIDPGSPRRARPRVGPAPAPIAWPGAAVVIDAIARSLAGSAAAILVVGARASGARELVDGAIRCRQLERVVGSRDPARAEPRLAASPRDAWPAAPIVGSLDEIGAAFAVPAPGPDAGARGWIERVARAARRCGAPVVVELGDDPRTPAVIRALSRADGGNPVVAIVDRDPDEVGDPAREQPGRTAGASRETEPADRRNDIAEAAAATAPRMRPGVAVHVAPVLDSDGVAALAAAMLGTPPPRAWAHALRVASSGLALAVIELVRSIAGEPNPFAVDWTARTTAGLAELRARQLRAAPAGARRVAAAIAAWGGRVRIDRALATVRAEGRPPAALADVAELERLGLAHRRGDEVTIDRATADAVEAIVGGDAIARLAGAALESVVRRDPESLPIAAPATDGEQGPATVGQGPATVGQGPATVGQGPATVGQGPATVGRDPATVGQGPASVGRGPATVGQGPATVGRPPATAGLTGEALLARPGSDRQSADRRRDATAADADVLAIAPLLERAVLDAGRAGLACEAGEQLLARGRPDRALGLAKRALAIDPARAGLVAARAATAINAYAEAASYARDAERAGADPVLARLAGARAAQRAGELDRAEAALAELHAAHSGHAEVAGTYARLLVTRSRYREARAIATAGGPLAGLRAEAAGLAAFYLGELEAADTAFAALEVGAAANGDGAAVGRASSLRGMVAQQRGQLGLASDRYREAARRLADAGELHAAATAELNLGTVLVERGRASEGLPRLAAAGRVFAELGATTEWCAAELNRGNALLLVGQVDEARTAAEAAIARAEGAPHLRAFALIVAGDARKRLGDELGAIASYREALAGAAQRGDAHAQISAHIALAEAGQREADPAVVEALCASDDDRDRWTLARGRLALRDPPSVARSASAAGRSGAGSSSTAAPSPAAGRSAAGSSSTAAPSLAAGWSSSAGSLSAGAAGLAGSLSDATLALAHGCAEVAARAGDADRLERAFRGHAIAAQLAHRARDTALAAREAERARLGHAALAAATAPAFRAALDGDPDLARLPGGEAPAPRPARAAGDTDSPQLRRLLTLSRRLNSEASVERILDDVIDTAIELTCAERGFLLLRQPDGELAAVVSRNFVAGDLDPSPGSTAVSRSVSRSIAERAAQIGEPVVTVDAGIDERFGAAASVAALRLRSVLAVPLRQRGAITGCIYVDHRLRGGAFDDAAASVLGELADIAAIAIENARLTGDLVRAAREVDALNRRLSSELADRDAELVRVKADLPDRDRLRHRYERIVGRSPATVKMLGVIDRAAATSLPVVIVGESGTGKELVARALHDHGARKTGPFVAINCSAVPETLLESELFGHARGSFTGAERDHRGLFEVADGGTLFLDEIADTGLAMQAKLLRVLQDGVIRRVGDTRTRQVDVRVIAASRQPLGELAAAGRFREDLRFRIDVIAVPVPPLRERDGDVPLLVESLLARLCAGKPIPRLTRAALRALGQHRWPGNVRELENALARGVAMGGDVIDLADLPEAIAHATVRPEPARPAVGEDLRLRPALGATERAYITAAMTRAKGNQTVAARLLGLSRFGLQKKLQRLAGAGEPDDD